MRFCRCAALERHDKQQEAEQDCTPFRQRWCVRRIRPATPGVTRIAALIQAEDRQAGDGCERPAGISLTRCLPQNFVLFDNFTG